MLALLVGVADYQDNYDFDDLKGPALDVALVREALIGVLHVEPSDIRTLVDGEATVEGILRAFDEHLLRRARTGDEVLWYFSGHGSRVRDLTLSERGLRDSSLVAADSRIDGRDGSHDLSDDIVYSLLRPLTDRGIHVTLITDSCHSGGAARGNLRVRGIAPGTRAPTELPTLAAWPPSATFFDDDARPARDELTNYVHIAACSPEQQAYECTFPDGVHGLLTWALVDALRTTGSGSWRALAQSAAARVDSVPGLPPQSTWIEGPDVDRPMFGRGTDARVARFLLRRVAGIGMVGDAGSVHGIVPGARIDAFDAAGGRVGQIEVATVSLQSCVGDWITPPPTVAPGQVLLGDVVEIPKDTPRLAIRVREAAVATGLSDLAWATVVGDGDDFAYELEHVAGVGWHLRTAEGISVWATSGPDFEHLPIPDLDAACRREARFVALWRLADPDRRGALHELRVAFVEPEPEELTRRPGSRTVETVYSSAAIEPCKGTAAAEYTATLPTFAPDARDPKDNQLAVLEITSDNPESVYLHVLSLNEAREIVVLFPDPGVRDRPVTADAPTKRVRTAVGAMPVATFPLDRPMRERYLVIATRTPLPDLHLLEQRIEPATTRGTGDALPSALRIALGGGLVRSGGTGGADLQDFGVAWVDLLISRR